LLAHGADINAVNDAGDTPLHKAAFIGREVWLGLLRIIFTVDLELSRFWQPTKNVYVSYRLHQTLSYVLLMFRAIHHGTLS
jgi:hypothetical protein